MMSTTANCLGCNETAAVHNRRLLSGPTAGAVKSAWKEIVAAKVEADKESSDKCCTGGSQCKFRSLMQKVF